MGGIRTKIRNKEYRLIKCVKGQRAFNDYISIFPQKRPIWLFYLFNKSVIFQSLELCPLSNNENCPGNICSFVINTELIPELQQTFKSPFFTLFDRWHLSLFLFLVLKKFYWHKNYLWPRTFLDQNSKKNFWPPKGFLKQNCLVLTFILTFLTVKLMVKWFYKYLFWPSFFNSKSIDEIQKVIK